MSASTEVVTACVDAGRADALLRGCFEQFPHARLAVTGRCMTPALRPGDTALLVPAHRHRPRLGEVVLVRLPDGLRLHRLVLGPPRHGSVRRTKADRSSSWDPPHAASDLLGTVVAVERQGRMLPAPRRLGPTLGSLARLARSWVGLGLRSAHGDEV